MILFGGLFLLTLLSACDRRSAETPPAGVGNPAQEEAGSLEKLDFFRVDVDVSSYLSSEDVSPTLSQKFTVTMKGPDKFRVESRDGQPKAIQICDGAKVYAYDGALNEYWVSEASGANFEFGPRFVLMGAARQFISPDGAAFLSTGVTTTTMEDMVLSDQEKLRHIVRPDRMMSFEFWVNQAPTARLKKARMYYKKNAPPSLAGLIIFLEYSNWVIDPTDPPEPFTFTPPEGARQVEQSPSVPKPVAAPETAELPGLDQLWSYPDHALGMVVDRRKGVLTISPSLEEKAAALLNPEGQVVGRAGNVLTPMDVCALSISNLERKEGLLVSSVMNAKGRVIGYDLSGKKLWEANTSGRVEALAIADSEGDSTRTVIVGSDVLELGYLGRLQALGAKGRSLWENKLEDSVKNIYVVDLDGDGAKEILALSFSKTVEQFNLSGQREKTYPFPSYLNFLGFLSQVGKKEKTLIGFEFDKGVLTAYDDRAKEPWRLDLPGNQYIHSAVSAETRPWLALSTSEGMVYILDLEKKSILRQFSVGHAYPKVAWLEPSEQTAPRLLLATGMELKCYSVREEK
jgi:outer membrane lipoprotein-sorting protein